MLRVVLIMALEVLNGMWALGSVSSVVCSVGSVVVVVVAVGVVVVVV